MASWLTRIGIFISAAFVAFLVWWFGFRVSAEQQAIDERAAKILSEDGQVAPSLGELGDDMEALGLDAGDEEEAEAFLDELLEESN